LQLFYIPKNKYTTLEGEEFFHCIKVLRKKETDKIFFTDGSGNLFSSIIKKINKHSCELDNIEKIKSIQKENNIEVAVSIIKSQNRLEWMVEKLSEIGISRITFVLSENSEKKKLKYDRIIKKTISALKQCNSLFLTDIQELILLEDYLKKTSNIKNKFFADLNSNNIFKKPINKEKSLILIGPEGDFSNTEKDLILKNNFKSISLGSSILRTETAAIVGGFMLRNF
tara:strand:+ start:1165 stop:1845 length:681 start_codon:yes stop_codon:yes gene_type:complete